MIDGSLIRSPDGSRDSTPASLSAEEAASPSLEVITQTCSVPLRHSDTPILLKRQGTPTPAPRQRLHKRRKMLPSAGPVVSECTSIYNISTESASVRAVITDGQWRLAYWDDDVPQHQGIMELLLDAASPVPSQAIDMWIAQQQGLANDRGIRLDMVTEDVECEIEERRNQAYRHHCFIGRTTAANHEDSWFFLVFQAGDESFHLWTPRSLEDKWWIWNPLVSRILSFKAMYSADGTIEYHTSDIDVGDGGEPNDDGAIVYAWAKDFIRKVPNTVREWSPCNMPAKTERGLLYHVLTGAMYTTASNTLLTSSAGNRVSVAMPALLMLVRHSIPTLERLLSRQTQRGKALKDIFVSVLAAPGATASGEECSGMRHLRWILNTNYFTHIQSALAGELQRQITWESVRTICANWPYAFVGKWLSTRRFSKNHLQCIASISAKAPFAVATLIVNTIFGAYIMGTTKPRGGKSKYPGHSHWHHASVVIQGALTDHESWRDSKNDNPTPECIAWVSDYEKSIPVEYLVLPMDEWGIVDMDVNNHRWDLIDDASMRNSLAKTLTDMAWRKDKATEQEQRHAWSMRLIEDTGILRMESAESLVVALMDRIDEFGEQVEFQEHAAGGMRHSCCSDLEARVRVVEQENARLERRVRGLEEENVRLRAQVVTTEHLQVAVSQLPGYYREVDGTARLE